MSSEPVKFLIVDDIEDNLTVLEALLRRDGLQILQARSGAAALELLLVHEVALALLDVQMPDMDGFELAELMRGAERTKYVPIIFVTAGVHSPARVFKGYETGAVDFLIKPIEPHVLRSKADVFFELYRQRKQLAHALAMSEMFVGILGHDLRNPLGAILTGAHLLEHQLQGDAELRTLRRMTRAGERMSEMIEQLLDLTRARLLGGLDLARAMKPLDVGEVVARAVEELRGADSREISLSTQGECDLTADADRLLQVFSNLIGNAIQHGTPGSSIAVRVEGCADELVVSVHNHGSIPAELLPGIFDPFRTRERGAASSRGLGLGLFISQQIAIAHDGNVRVESNPATGTLFTVRLPRGRA